jgi:hypothetical protein
MHTGKPRERVSYVVRVTSRTVQQCSETFYGIPSNDWIDDVYTSHLCQCERQGRHVQFRAYSKRLLVHVNEEEMDKMSHSQTQNQAQITALSPLNHFPPRMRPFALFIKLVFRPKPAPPLPAPPTPLYVSSKYAFSPGLRAPGAEGRSFST